MNGWKIMMWVIGGIAILITDKFSYEMFGVILLIISSIIQKNKIIIRKIK